MVYKFVDKNFADSGVTNNEIKQNLKLVEKLQKPINKNFKKRKVYSEFKYNIWGANLADMRLISKLNKQVRFLLYVIDIFRKYSWVLPLKDKKDVSVVNAFQKTLDKSGRTSNKIFYYLNIWVDKGSEIYNNSFKKLL